MCFEYHNNIQYRTYEELLNILCRENNLPNINIRYNSDYHCLGLNRLGYFHAPESNDNETYIMINDDLYYKRIIPVIYHEFRHYWQYINYRSIYYQWLGQNRKLYIGLNCINSRILHLICELELDADAFKESKGRDGLNFLLDNFKSPMKIKEYIKEFRLIQSIV